MTDDTKSLRVQSTDDAKRTQYFAKELLLAHDVIDVIAGTYSAPTAARACENLVRLNYVTYVDIKTNTNVVNDKRKTSLTIRIKKTSEFKKLYDENEAIKKKKQEEFQRENKE